MSARDRARWPSVEGYQIRSEIGRGGFASVFEAVQESVGRRVALKVLSAAGTGADLERRFRSECRTIGELSWHPHVVALHDAGFSAEGLPYMAMELLPSGSIADRVEESGSIEPAEVARIGVEIADALEAAHSAGVVHRDVKPANILVGRRGEYLLGDFGIATIADATRSATGSFSGTYAFAAPEVHQGKRASPRSDVFALGATLYTLLTGRSPFLTGTEDSPSAVILRVVSEPAPPLPPFVPRELASVIDKAMTKDPADRLSSAAAFQLALRAVTETESEAKPESPDAPPDDSGGSAGTRSVRVQETRAPLPPTIPRTIPATRPPPDGQPVPASVHEPARSTVTALDRRSGHADPDAPPNLPHPSRRTVRTILMASAVILAGLVGVVGIVVRSQDSGVPATSTETTTQATTTQATTTTTAADEAASGDTIVDIAADDDEQFSTLVTAVTEAGLAETLSGDGPFTVFAPTNAAFEALPTGTVDTLLDDPTGDLTYDPAAARDRG